MIKLFFLLLCAHAIGDFALQTDTMARSKNRHATPPKTYDPLIHGKLQATWFYYLSTHALCNGFMVYFVTNNFCIGMLETLSHWLIDFAKGENLHKNIHLDQFLHLVTKIIWLILIYYL